MFNYTDEKGDPKIGKIIWHVVLGLFVVFPLLWSTWFTVDTGSVGIVTRFGNVSRIAPAGLNFKLPYIEDVTVMGVQTQKEQVETSAASKDLQEVTTAIAVNYNVREDQVATLFREVRENYKSVIVDPAIMEALKASTANYTAEELVTKREIVRAEVKALLKEKLSPRHIEVTEISMTNFQFSPSFEQAIEAKVTTEQNALAAKNKLAQVQFEADQRVAQAKGEAEAIRIQAAAIQAQGGKEYVELQFIKAWEAGGSKVPQFISGSANSPFMFNMNNLAN